MQVSMEELSGVQRRMTITVPSEEFESKVNSRLQDAKNKVRLPGFRPGKVPMKEVRRRFGPAIRADAAEELMRSCYGESVAEQELWPAGAPRLEVLNMDAGADFAFTASFEVLPDVQLADFSTFKILRPEAEVTDVDVDEMLETLRRQRRTWRKVERTAQLGDRVAVDYEGRLDDEPVGKSIDEPVGESVDEPDNELFDRGEDVSFVLGESELVEGFEKAALGMAAGEAKKFDTAFPEDYRDERLRGRKVSFDLSLKTVEEAELPALDEAFFESMGVKEGGLAAFREEVAGNMRREMKAKVRTQVKNQVMQALHRSHEVPLPEALVQQQINASKNAFAARLSLPEQRASGLPDEMFREGAEKTVALNLISRQIAKDHEVKAESEAVRAEVERMAEVYADPDAVVRAIYQDESRLAGFESMVIENKIVEVVLQQAAVEAVACTYQDVVAERAVPAAEEEAAPEAPAEAPDQQKGE